MLHSPAVVFVAVLVLLAVASSALSARARIPHPLALVAGGAVLGLAGGRWTALAPGFRLGPDVMFRVLLPLLLFEGAYRLPAREVRKRGALIALLAVPGVLVGVAVGAALAWGALRALGRPIDGATLLVFSAIVSATDPVAVIALLREARAPLSLRVVLDAESLLNDGMAVVVLRVAGVLTGLTLGSDAAASGGGAVIAGRALWEVAGGVALGAALGEAAARVQRLAPRMAAPATVVVAFGAYALAERAHASAILAVVAAGFVSGNRAPATRIVDVVWTSLAFAANATVFLLVGLELDPRRLAPMAIPIVVAWAALLVARALFVHASIALARARDLAGRGAWVLTMSGLRGGLSMVLALGLPASPVRDVVRDLTFGVVALTLGVQGLALFAARRLWRRQPP